jgi:hypothetical protein
MLEEVLVVAEVGCETANAEVRVNVLELSSLDCVAEVDLSVPGVFALVSTLEAAVVVEVAALDSGCIVGTSVVVEIELLPVDCRLVDLVYKHSSVDLALAVVVICQLAIVVRQCLDASHEIENLVVRCEEWNVECLVGVGKPHWASAATQTEYLQDVETMVGSEDDEASWLEVVNVIQRGRRDHHHHRHHRPSCHCNHLGPCVRVRHHTGEYVSKGAQCVQYALVKDLHCEGLKILT